MLRRDLTHIVNTRDAWLFLGSGASIPSGYPNWPALIQRTYKALDEDLRNAVRRSGRYQKAVENHDYIAAATHLEAAAGRPEFLNAFRTAFKRNAVPNRITKLLANWPFQGIVTSNYDPLMQQALRAINEKNWQTVGNTTTEVKKVSRDPAKILWHVHGFIDHDTTKSDLVISGPDYDRVYAKHSAMSQQLQGLLAMKQIIFVGFGFNDAELRRVLEGVGQLTTPLRPIVAILPNTITDTFKDELFLRYNVSPILYAVGADGNHNELAELLELHDPFILGRTQEYGNPDRRCEPYDEQTTGLLIYNELTLKHRAAPGPDVLAMILKSKVLARLSIQACSTTELVLELDRLAKDVDSAAVGLPPEFALKVIQSLVDENRIVVREDGLVALTPSASDFVQDQRSVAERERDAFANSLYQRVANKASGLDETQVRRIAQLAEDFFADSVKRRAIGVAHALYSDRFQDFSVTTLLQSLPDYTGRSASVEQALPLVSVIQEVLLRPTAEEKRFLGFLLQAQFAIHLLGFDSATVEIRLRELAETMFLLDSYSLLPYLATDAPSHQAIRTLVGKLQSIKATVATTSRLIEEVTGHAGRAIARYGNIDPQSFAAFKAATGYAGSNVFVAGFQVAYARGDAGSSFSSYMADRCRLPLKKVKAGSTVVRDVLRSDGVIIIDLADCDGYTTDMKEEVDKYAARLTERRKKANSYKGTWQIDSEAEALVLVRHLRTAKLRLAGKEFRNAYFVSPTGMIDMVGPEKHITVKADALLQSIAVLTSWTLAEMEILADSIFAEVTDRNVEVVPTDQLEYVFHPLQVSAKRTVDVVLAEHHDLLAEKLGADGIEQVRSYANPDIPLLAERITHQVLVELRSQNAELRRLTEATEKKKLDIKERQEFERLKNKERDKGKRNKAKRQRRKARRARRELS